MEEEDEADDDSNQGTLRPQRQDSRPRVPVALLPIGDARAKHVVHHLRKTDGDLVEVGILGVTQQRGLAKVQLWSSKEVENRKCTQSNEQENGKKHSATVQGVKLVLQFVPNWPETAMVRHESSVLANDRQLQQQPFPRLTLILALPFPKRLKALWPVIASMGVTHVIVVRGQLSDPEHGLSTALQPKVYEPLLLEGQSQGVHTRTIRVDICVDQDIVSRGRHSLESLIQDECSSACAGCAKVFLDCGDEHAVPPPVRDVVLQQLLRRDSSNSSSQRSIPNNDDECHSTSNVYSAVLAVGPERGWTQAESDWFCNELGYVAATLGRSVLRVDTAVVAGLAMVSAALEEPVSMGET